MVQIMRLNSMAKRVMTNIRLDLCRRSGDFPVDNDFRRIGIIKDPYNLWNNFTLQLQILLNGLMLLKLVVLTADFIADEVSHRQ
jgi:hypothetical protein